MKNINNLMNKIAEVRDESEKQNLTIVSHFLDLAIEELCLMLEEKEGNSQSVQISSEILQKYFGNNLDKLLQGAE